MTRGFFVEMVDVISPACDFGDVVRIDPQEPRH
jgi:hypothetical protein